MSNIDITILFVLAVVCGAFALAAFLVMDLQLGLAFGFVCALLLKVMIAGVRRS